MLKKALQELFGNFQTARIDTVEGTAGKRTKERSVKSAARKRE